MPLLVNLRHLAVREVAFKGELSVTELGLQSRDPMIEATQPLHYDFVVEKVNESLLVRGGLRIRLDCQCVRCLERFVYDLEMEGALCELALEGEEKVPVVNDCVDLTPHLRDDIFLEFPRHPVCRPECRGLRPAESADHSEPTGATGVRLEPASAWDALNKLKL